MEIRVLVADNARARIFTSHTTIEELEEAEDFIHNEAHQPEQDFVSDSAGKSRNPHGTLDYTSSPKEHDTGLFAQSLARHLKELHDAQHFQELILIAPPRFLGLLRLELRTPLTQLVSRSIDKDLTTARVGDIIKYIKS